MFTFQGIGTKFLGSREQGSDGSYITTKWFVIFFLPIIPLGSYRVLKIESDPGIFNSSSKYQSVPVPLHWQQVLITYAIGWPIFIVILYIIGS